MMLHFSGIPKIAAILLSIWIINTSPHPIRSRFRTGMLQFQSRSPPLRSMASPSIANPTCGICGSSYTAGAGETLESIASHCQVSPGDAAAANPGIDPANLTGIPLSIPCNNASSSRCGICGASYRIKNQDILFDVAQSCGMDLATLEIANPDIDYENVYPGQLIRLPCMEPNATMVITKCGSCGIAYTVAVTNETLSNVSKNCGVSIDDLVLANHLPTNVTLIQNQRLRVPCNVTIGSNCGLCGSSYTVLETDNRRVVAAKCRIGFIDLQSSNPKIDLDDLKPGQRIQIPCKNRIEKCSRHRHLCNETMVATNRSSVFEMAKFCNVTPELISYANDVPIDAPVYPGQILEIPCEDSPVPLRSCSICGSSVAPSVAVDLTTVSRVCGVTVTGIQQATEINLTDVAFGDVLQIPCRDNDLGCGPCGVAYKALDDDSLASIAVKCSIFISEIRSANPTLNFSDSIAGKLVSIPCRFSAVSFGSSRPDLLPRKLVLALLIICLLL